MKDKDRCTFLLVEPNPQAMGPLGAVLEEMGFFTYFQAANGSEALTLFKNYRPEVVIARQTTPVINGLSLLQMVRQEDQADRETVFILYEESVSTLLAAQAGRLGINGLINLLPQDEGFKNKVDMILNPEPEPQEIKARELYELSVEQLRSGELDQALDTCRNILQLGDHAEVYYNMGYILCLKGELDRALYSFRQATVINGRHARAYTHMGLIYKEKGQKREAESCLRIAAKIHLERNQNSEAEEIFNTVLSLKPDTINVYNSLGIIYRRQGRPAEALSAYEKALKVHPRDEYILFNMARALLELGQEPRAKLCLERALSINSVFREAQDLRRALDMGLTMSK